MLFCRYACPVDDGQDVNVTHNTHPNTHPTHEPHTTTTHSNHHHTNPTHNPCPTYRPDPNGNFENCQCLVDDQVAISKKTIIITGASLFVILILCMVISMYCTLLCMAKKETPPKPKRVNVYTVETDKKQLLA